jgi:hypothetical protein
MAGAIVAEQHHERERQEPPGPDRGPPAAGRAEWLPAHDGPGLLLRGLERRGGIHVRSDRAGDPAHPGRLPLRVGGIQPGPLERYLRAVFAGRGDDGLLQRFQLAVWPDGGGRAAGSGRTWTAGRTRKRGRG